MAKENLGLCLVATCTGALVARGLCGKCYKKAQRSGTLPAKQRWINPVKHNHPLYQVWVGMKARCTNLSSVDYKDYGARGISICIEWLQFPAFYEDLQTTYVKGLILDRRDNNGNYSKDNCRWVTPTVSAQNRRSTKLNERSVLLIRELFQSKPPEESRGAFNARTAPLFGIEPITVNNITSNRQWKTI